MPFDFLATLRALVDHGVDFVVIGGIGGRVWGSPSVTADTDICYARDRANLARLADALADLGARLRGVDDDVTFLVDADTIGAGDTFTFVTRHGDLDVIGTPDGTTGYQDLAAAAVEVDLDGMTVRVAALDDLIRMKRATGRAKDRAEVEILEALRDEIEREGPATP